MLERPAFAVDECWPEGVNSVVLNKSIEAVLCGESIGVSLGIPPLFLLLVLKRCHLLLQVCRPRGMSKQVCHLVQTLLDVLDYFYSIFTEIGLELRDCRTLRIQY